MTEEEKRQIELSDRQLLDGKLHYEQICNAVLEAEYKLFQMLKPKLFTDGNKWCVLYGEDIQTGIVGFGETPHKAILDWNGNWHKTK